jgi:hypothetical protein
MVVMLNTILNNISDISVLLMDETGVPEENQAYS